MNDCQIQAAIIPLAMLAFRGDVVGFHHLIPLQGFQVNVEAPEPVQVLEYFLG
jgi:hypothetical protein